MLCPFTLLREGRKGWRLRIRCSLALHYRSLGFGIKELSMLKAGFSK